MSRRATVRHRVRVAGLLAASALSVALAAALLVAPGLLRAAHPLPLALAFLVIAALAGYVAARLRRDLRRDAPRE